MQAGDEDKDFPLEAAMATTAMSHARYSVIRLHRSTWYFKSIFFSN